MISCTDYSSGKITGQHLFLGATVLSFNVNMGWGGSPSTLTVELIEDKQPITCYDNYENGGINSPGSPLPHHATTTYPDNHYKTCVGNDCYVDELGRSYNPNLNPPPKEQRVPGKVYYAINSDGDIVSKYWLNEDPGFFGTGTVIQPDGTIDSSNTESLMVYDIIGIYVVFIMDSFIFSGIIKSWDKNDRLDGVTYSVVIESPDSILNNAYMILSDYGGSIFLQGTADKKNIDTLGFPANGYRTLNNLITYGGQISKGNIPNIFNIYGFLESFSATGFGGSAKNDNGISVSSVISALSVLTSSLHNNTSNPANDLELSEKRAFSPFGRILTKTMQETTDYRIIEENFGTNCFGVIPPVKDEYGIPRTYFVLDLSELPQFPAEFRIPTTHMSIIDFLRTITSESGTDFFCVGIPLKRNNKPLNVIKIKTVSRTAQPLIGSVGKTINEFKKNNIPITNGNVGIESNESSSPRALYIGGKQQRLYQAKNYRLAYSQANYIYDPAKHRFINFDRFNQPAAGIVSNNPLFFWNKQAGKIRIPSYLSTRNPWLSDKINGENLTELWNDQEKIKEYTDNSKPDTKDKIWADVEIGGTEEPINVLNYDLSKSISRTDLNTKARFLPLYEDVICPFFGYALEDNIEINTTEGTNNFRKVRPVFLDKWTGNLNVVVNIAEVPLTSLGKMKSIRQIFMELIGMSTGLPNLITPNNYPNNTILITETEMRCSSFDAYFEYCMLKSGPTKPDLFVMLLYTYMAARKPIFSNVMRTQSGAQNPAQANAALPAQGAMGAAGQPIPPQQGNMNNNGGLDWMAMLDRDFLNDLQRLHKFINKIAAYYGKKYMVRIPEIASYKDSAYADLQLPPEYGSVYVFNGSGKIFFNYEPCDKAWEEPGNIIDDTVVIGSAPSYALINEDGTFSTILGYNSTDSFDHVRQALCRMQINNAAAYLSGSSVTNLSGDKSSDPPENANLSWRKSVLRYDLEKIWQHLSLGTCDDKNFIFPSLNLSSVDKSSYIIMDTLKARQDAYGDPRPGQQDTLIRDPINNNPIAVSKKLYLTTSSPTTQDILFFEPEKLSNPRIVVSSPGISLNPSSLIYETDPTATVISNVAIEDLIIYSNIFPIIQLNAKNNTISDSFINILLSYVSPVIGNSTLFINNTSNNQSTKHRTLSPKMAHPFFAAVPVRFNQISYGPWTNYPILGYESFFPSADPNIEPDKEKVRQRIENLIVKTNFDIDSDLVPWNYGGMSFLDQYVLFKIQTNTDFQYLLESASVTIPGLPIFGIGGEFIYRNMDPALLRNKILYNNDIYTYEEPLLTYTQAYFDPNPPPKVPLPGNPVYVPLMVSPILQKEISYMIPRVKSDNKSSLAPIISNISLNLDPNNVSTTYSFRTYSKKLGLYSKEAADRLKTNAINNIKRNKQLSSITQSIINTTNSERQEVLDDRGGVLDIFSRFGTSPTELLIGSAFKYVDCPAIKTTYKNFNSINPGYIQDSDQISQLGSIPVSESVRYGSDRGDNTDSWDSVTGIMSKARHSTWVGSFQSKEAFSELVNQYSRKSAMSMDGIFSPISFFPTLYDSTYPMASYPRNNCPACKGSGYITDASSSNYIDDNIYKNQTFTDFACPLCSRRNLILDTTKNNTSVSQSFEKLPPYIIASGTDISLLSNFINSGGSSTTTNSASSQDTGTAINLYSLQPIVVPSGLFNNINAQNNQPILPNISGGIDRCRHSIQLVARGEFPQITNSIYLNKNLLSYFKAKNETPYGDFSNVQGQGVNADYYVYDIEKNLSENTIDKFLLNQRFFGMRGPIMMHGWGYDTEGYPVPNASDEPMEYDTLGRPKRFILASDGSNDYSKDGAFDPKSNQLGDIIGKGYKKDGGKWVKTKSKYFYLNWAERADLWPVGPVDLRWDESRRVWTASSSASIYKMVYVTLEEDLVKEDGFDETYPARAFLDDVEYTTQSLPNNARRLVYIKDRAGYTAPRGAKLLCRYDSDTGFYEPVSKPQYIVFGVLGNGTSATIELAYIQGLKRGENIPTMLTTFDNSKFKFKITSGKTGMFLYSNGKWILTSVES